MFKSAIKSIIFLLKTDNNDYNSTTDLIFAKFNFNDLEPKKHSTSRNKKVKVFENFKIG